MSQSTPKQDIRTLGFVLRRTNYGEADRILNIITPVGKISAIAKGVRKEKSKLAGGVEMFTLSDFNIHKGKSDIAVVTGARMVKHYGNIVKDFNKMELAGIMLKKIGRAADSSDNPEYFAIIRQGISGVDEGLDLALIEDWFLINLLKAMGEEVNLYRDMVGDKLDASSRYDWVVGESCFGKNENGAYGVDEIKMLRLMSATELRVVARVKGASEIALGVLPLIRTFAKM